jgi:hypothetical protein
MIRHHGVEYAHGSNGRDQQRRMLMKRRHIDSSFA